MTCVNTNEDRHAEAVEWFVRLQFCDDERVWRRHCDWLEADAGHCASFAEVEALWVNLDSLTETIARERRSM